MKKPAVSTVPQKKDEFFTVNDIATRMKISERQVRRYIARGDIQTTRIGRCVRISLGDLLSFEYRNRLCR